eukprot:3104213-Amphidinium_carterae.2
MRREADRPNERKQKQARMDATWWMFTDRGAYGMGDINADGECFKSSHRNDILNVAQAVSQPLGKELVAAAWKQ